MNLKQALGIIDSAEIFSLSVVKFNHRKKTGGQISFYSQVVASNPKQEREKSSPSVKGTQNHYDNGTRNLYKCIDGVPSSAFVKIHFVHVLEVNGERVML